MLPLHALPNPDDDKFGKKWDKDPDYFNKFYFTGEYSGEKARSVSFRVNDSIIAALDAQVASQKTPFKTRTDALRDFMIKGTRYLCEHTDDPVIQQIAEELWHHEQIGRRRQSRLRMDESIKELGIEAQNSKHVGKLQQILADGERLKPRMDAKQLHDWHDIEDTVMVKIRRVEREGE